MAGNFRQRDDRFRRFPLLTAHFIPYRLRFQTALGGVGKMVNHDAQPLGLVAIHAAEGQQAVLFKKIIDIGFLAIELSAQIVHHFFVPALRLKQGFLLLRQAVIDKRLRHAVGDIGGFLRRFRFHGNRNQLRGAHAGDGQVFLQCANRVIDARGQIKIIPAVKLGVLFQLHRLHCSLKHHA